MVILLIPATFISVFLGLTGYHVNKRTSSADWRMAFLQSATFLGGYMVLFSEFLSLFHALNSFWVAFFWGAALVFSVVLGWKKGWIATGISSLKNAWKKPDWFDILAGSLLSIILALLLVVALKSPVNNNDSLLYHMSRVVHWAQNSSLAHYATQYEHQLSNPIFAELCILNTRLLINSDLLANSIQWMAYIGAIIGISAIAKLLGNGRYGQWVSIAFAISIPMAILQSTNPQNDLVTAFWLICLLYFIFREGTLVESPLSVISLALAAGMGLATKGTFYVYAVAPMLYYLIIQLRASHFRKAIINFLIIGIVVIIINTGYWTRNILTFGTPLGSREFVSNHTANNYTLGRVLGTVSLSVMQNFATPDEKLNESIINNMKSIIGELDPNANQFSLIWAWNHEDFAGNPVQIFLMLAISSSILVFHNKFRISTIHYLLVILGIFILLSSVVFYGVFGIRFQMPIIMAFSPLVGSAVEKINHKRLSILLTILFLLSAFPWVLFNRTRPLIAMRDSSDPFTIPCLAGCTTGSILIEPPEKTMFAVWGNLGAAYVEAMNQVKETGCKNIGLKLDSNDLEYAYWYLLGAPQNGMRLESIVSYPELERYLDTNFKPCVIICTTCGEQTHLFGLERIGSYGDGRIKIYSGENYDIDSP
jgi:hypothetical protein